MNLALFDLDNTLLAGDSVSSGAFLIGSACSTVKYTNRKCRILRQYKSGTLDIHAFLIFS